MSAPIIDVKNLKVEYKVYEGSLKVLNGIYLKIYPGEKIGLVGETGCGKTTTMKSIMRILPRSVAEITAGEIIYQGQDILKLKPNEINRFRRKNLSAIFENPSAALNPVFTVGQQLRAVIRCSTDKKLSEKEVKQRAIEVLRDVALPDPERLLDNYPIQCSGGMRQRICIALALISSSQLLIADEPGTNLDVTIQDQILRLLMNLVEEKNTTIIYITHSLGVLKEWIDRVYVMYAGDIVEMAKTKEIFNKPFHPYTVGLMEAVPKLSGGGISKGIPGRVPDYISPPSGCRFHPRCKKVMEQCRKEKPDYYELGNGHYVACFLGSGI